MNRHLYFVLIELHHGSFIFIILRVPKITKRDPFLLLIELG